MKPFAPGVNVSFIHEQLGRLPARIERVDDGAVVLSLYVRPETPVAWLEPAYAHVEAIGARGIHRAGGAVSAEGSGLDAPVRVELSGASEVVQRREYVRVDALVPITLRVGAEDAEPVRTSATNVSGAGFLLAGRAGLEVGAPVWFMIELPGVPPIEGRAEVVREAPEGMRGCAIQEIPEQGRDLLVRFTFDRQRMELRRVRP